MSGVLEPKTLEEGAVVCPTCGCPKDFVSDQAETIEALTETTIKQSREISRLGRLITKQEKAKRDHKTIRKVFDYWVLRCGKDPKRTKLTGDRADAVQYCIDTDYVMDDFECAINGAAVDAYVDEKGKRFDDLELICRKNTKNIEDFMGRWERWQRRQEVVALEQAELIKRREMLMASAHYTSDQGDYMAGTCPLCEGLLKVTVETWGCKSGCIDDEIEMRLMREVAA